MPKSMPKQKTSRPKVNPDCLVTYSLGDDREVSLIRGGRSAYLWIGDDRFCYGTLSGAGRLRRLAEAILAEVPPPTTKARAAK